MNKIVKAVLVVAFFYLVIMGLLGLQYLFDRGDMKKAAQVIYEYRPRTAGEGQGGLTLAQAMAVAYGVAEDRLKCETKIASRFEGRVLVECDRAADYQKISPHDNFQWEVNVTSGQVTPLNAKAKGLFSWQKSASES